MEDKPVFKFAIREDLQDTGDLFLPKQGEPFATGYDVKAAPPDRRDIIIRPGEFFKIPLGFRCIPEPGWWYQLNPRSSSFIKKHLQALIGIIDEHFPLEAIWVGKHLVDMYSLRQDPVVIKFGDPIGQLIPFKRQEMQVEKISNQEFQELHEARKTVRTGGFGSTTEPKAQETSNGNVIQAMVSLGIT